MNYTLHQLKVFLKVVETQSITKASAELQLTQPAVSIQLKNFQEQFDIPLTEVIGRQLHVTAFGREIAASAKQILDQADLINYKTYAYKGLLTGKLRLSVVSTGKYVMPYFLTDFLKRNPGVDLAIDVTNKLRVLESLEKNEVDLALVSIPPTHLRVEKLELLQNKLFLVGNKRVRLDSPGLLKDFMEQVPLIFREEGSGTRQMMEKFLERNKLLVRKKIELTSNEAVKQALIAGLGYSIVPLIGLREELRNKKLFIIPVKGLPIRTNWILIWPKGKQHAPVSLSFLNFLKENRTQIEQVHFDWYDRSL